MKGEGGQQDYGMRIYDPRLGRFLSIYPLARSYPWYTSYQFIGNMPIVAIDLDGSEEQIVSAKLANSAQFGTVLEVLQQSKIVHSFLKKFSAQNNYVLVYTSFSPERANPFGDSYIDPNWNGSTRLISSEIELRKDWVASNIEYSEVEKYIKEGKKIIVIGIAEPNLNFETEQAEGANTIDNLTQEIRAVWTTVHEMIAHGEQILETGKQTGAEDHEKFQGERSATSPGFSELLSDEKYAKTRAGKLAKQLMKFYKEEIVPIITKTTEDHKKAAKIVEKNKPVKQ